MSYCLNFNGTSGRGVEIPFSSSLNNANFTVELWARVTGGEGTVRSAITSRDQNGSNLCGYIIYAGTDDRWQFWLGEGWQWHSLAGPPIEKNKWVHLAATYEYANAQVCLMKFYVNGVKVAETKSGFWTNGRQPLRIGGGATETPEGNYGFCGQIRGVLVWDYVRSEGQIRTSMTQPVAPNEAGLKGCWRCNEGSGTVVRDLASAGGVSNGNVVAGATWLPDPPRIASELLEGDRPEILQMIAGHEPKWETVKNMAKSDAWKQRNDGASHIQAIAQYENWLYVATSVRENQSSFMRICNLDNGACRDFDLDALEHPCNIQIVSSYLIVVFEEYYPGTSDMPRKSNSRAKIYNLLPDPNSPVLVSTIDQPGFNSAWAGMAWHPGLECWIVAMTPGSVRRSSGCEPKDWSIISMPAVPWSGAGNLQLVTSTDGSLWALYFDEGEIVKLLKLIEASGAVTIEPTVYKLNVPKRSNKDLAVSNNLPNMRFGSGLRVVNERQFEVLIAPRHLTTGGPGTLIDPQIVRISCFQEGARKISFYNGGAFVAEMYVNANGQTHHSGHKMVEENWWCPGNSSAGAEVIIKHNTGLAWDLWHEDYRKTVSGNHHYVITGSTLDAKVDVSDASPKREPINWYKVFCDSLVSRYSNIGSWIKPLQGTVLKTFEMPEHYVVSFDIKVLGTSPAWGSILQVNATGDDDVKKPGSRIPAFFLCQNDTKLHVSPGTRTASDRPKDTLPLPLNKIVQVWLVALGSTVRCYLDGVLALSWDNHERQAYPNAKLYCGSPWQNSGNYQISNVKVGEAKDRAFLFPFTGTLMPTDGKKYYLVHRESGMYVQPKGGEENPPDGTKLVWGLEPNKLASQFVFDSGQIKHVRSGKYIHPSGGKAGNDVRLCLNTGCESARTGVQLVTVEGRTYLQHPGSQCYVHPYGGSASPGNDTELVYSTGCKAGVSIVVIPVEQP